MSNYNKPTVVVNQDTAEGVFAASGAAYKVDLVRTGDTTKTNLCIWFSDGQRDLTGVTIAMTFATPVRYDIHNFDATKLTENSEMISFTINSPARLHNGSLDYNISAYSLDGVTIPGVPSITSSAGDAARVEEV